VDYQDFVEAERGSRPELEEIDVEEFVAYLDHEHFFGFLGSDTFSQEGNRPQLLLRWGIGRFLQRALRLPTSFELPRIAPSQAAFGSRHDGGTLRQSGRCG
jgi:hypothetical protein